MGIIYNSKYNKINGSAMQDISLAQIYFSEAEELRLNKKFKEAIDKYLHSILINRNNHTSYIGLAIAYKNLKNYNKAIKSLKKAEILQPDDINVQKELALCNIIKSDFSNGIKHLISSIKLEPDNIEFQMQLALVHEMIEEEDMALMIYQKIIETEPKYIRAYIQKATLYMYLEDYLNSAKTFKEVLKLQKDYYRAYLAIGICYEKLGNKQGAKRFYKKYITLSNNSSNKKEVTKRIIELESVKNKVTHNLKLL